MEAAEAAETILRTTAAWFEALPFANQRRRVYEMYSIGNIYFDRV
jgi:hypothetical protein